MCVPCCYESKSSTGFVESVKTEKPKPLCWLNVTTAWKEQAMSVGVWHPKARFNSMLFSRNLNQNMPYITLFLEKNYKISERWSFATRFSRYYLNPFPPKPRTLVYWVRWFYAYSCLLIRGQLHAYSSAYCCVLPIYIGVLGDNFLYLLIYKVLFNFGGIKQGRDRVSFFFFRDTFFRPEM